MPSRGKADSPASLHEQALRRIDRVLNAIKEMVAAAKVVGPIGEGQIVPGIYEEGSVGPLKTFYAKCIDLDNQKSSMEALKVYLEDQNYKDDSFCFKDLKGPTFLGVQGLMALYSALVTISPALVRPYNQNWFGEADRLRQALLKARKWLKAQKQSKRKRKDDVYVWLNATEAGRYLGTSSKTITTWIREKTLQTYDENGTRYKFLKAELDAKKATYKPRTSRKTGD
jgi:excisionase family DNA binding protein